MTAYRFTGFYPAHYDTPEGSRMVRLGEVVDWDLPPDHWWQEESTSEAPPRSTAQADEFAMAAQLAAQSALDTTAGDDEHVTSDLPEQPEE